jgi:hypothetical protein
MMNTAREELKQAHAARHAAQSARDAARQATGRARASLEEVIRQAKALEAGDSRAERERLAEVTASFLTGAAPCCVERRGPRRSQWIRCRFPFSGEIDTKRS